MSIKRYAPVLLCNAKSERELRESPTGDWYHRADLIAAGCLVPVLEGEVLTVAQLAPGQHFTYNRNCYRATSWVKGRLVAMQSTDEEPNTFDARTIVQPVRLVRLEDMG